MIFSFTLPAIATEVERPVHRKEDVVVNNIGLVVIAGLLCVKRDNVDNFSQTEATPSIGPNDFVLGEFRPDKETWCSCT